MTDTQAPAEGTAGARKPRVAVVFGGQSSEHAISCVTAGSVLAAIDPDRYDVVPIGITTDGRWVLEEADPERFAIHDADSLPGVDGDRPPITITWGAEGTTLVVGDGDHGAHPMGAVDVAFPLLHGPLGEDGTVQGLFEMAGLRYVGAGVLASAVSMDKAYMKLVLASAGLPVLAWEVVTRTDWERDPDECEARVAALGYPVFAKPARGGSSIGISKVSGVDQLAVAIDAALEHDPKVLVEVAAADAREVECGVLQALDGRPETSVPAEIRVGGDHEFYDFAAKYLPGEHTRLDVPADIDPALARQVQELSVGAFEAVGCEGLARVDFFVLPDGRLLINEINTMPGFTPVSMFPRMWAATGVDYPTLIDRLVQLALRRGTGLR